MAYQHSIVATTLRRPAAVENRRRSLPAHCEGDTDGDVAHGKLAEWNFGLFPCQSKNNRIENAILQTCGRDTSSASGVGLLLAGFLSLQGNHHRNACGSTRLASSWMLFFIRSAGLSATGRVGARKSHRPQDQSKKCITTITNLIFVVPCIMLYSGEISPTRCNNFVFYSQWFYSTCFG